MDSVPVVATWKNRGDCFGLSVSGCAIAPGELDVRVKTFITQATCKVNTKKAWTALVVGRQQLDPLHRITSDH